MYSIFLSLFISFFLIYKVSIKTKQVLDKYLNIEVKRFTSIILNRSINKKLTNKYLSDLYKIKKDKQGRIELIDYNTKKVNNLLEDLTEEIQKDLLSIEEGKIEDLNVSRNFKGNHFKSTKNGIICELPITTIYKNPLLVNIGPVIPLRLSFIGSVNTSINTKIKNYGINNLYLELNIHVELIERITLPLTTKDTKVVNNIPISIKIIQGTIPKYYDSLSKNSNLYQLPISK